MHKGQGGGQVHIWA